MSQPQLSQQSPQSQQQQQQSQPSQQVEDEEMQAGPAGAKAKVTRKRYTREMIVMLLEIVDEVLPYGNKDWEVIAAKYNQIFSDDRDYVSVRKKYFDLVPKGVPVPLQTAENIRADLVQKRIHIRQQTGVFPPPTPPEVLIALYTNSNLPLPGFLRSYAQNNPTNVTISTMNATNNAGHEMNTSNEIEVSVTTSSDGNSSSSQQTPSLLGKRKSNSDSLMNLSTSNNNNNNTPAYNNSNNNNNNNGNNNAVNLSTILFPPNNFIATTTTITASMANNLANYNNNHTTHNGNTTANSNSVKNEDYQQYCANPQLFKPSPIGAGLSTILYKILQSSSLRNTSPTLLPAKTPLGNIPLNAEEDNPETAGMVTLANLADRRKNGVLFTELGKLEEILLELYAAHEKLGVYMAGQMQQMVANNDEVETNHNHNETANNGTNVDTQIDETATTDNTVDTNAANNVSATAGSLTEMHCTGPELVQLNTAYTTSYACVQQVAQWLETFRPHGKKLRLTPYQLQKMRRSGGASTGNNNTNSKPSEMQRVGNSKVQAKGVPGAKGDTKGTSSVDDEEGLDDEEDEEEEDEEEEGTKKEIDDEAADDFEDLYVGKNNSMDTD